MRGVPEGSDVRRLGATIAVAMLSALTFAGPAEAAKPPLGPPVVTSVTITESGGTWPYCEQVATVVYVNGHRPGTIAIWPYLEMADSAGSYGATVRTSGTIVIAIAGEDYSQTSTYQPTGYFWVAQTGNVRTLLVNRSITTTYDFSRRCPAPGTVLATGTLPLPSTWG
jgi:hypothetical protein